MKEVTEVIGLKGCVDCEVSQRRNAHAKRGEVPLILPCWNADAVGGMCGVAVKCIDITQNTECEGISRIRD